MNETVRDKHRREALAYLRQREAETGALKVEPTPESTPEPTPGPTPEPHESELSQLRRELRQLTGRVAALENKM